MTLNGKTDEQFAQVVRCALGFTYAHFQNHIIGEDPIVLKGAGKEGKDLRYAAKWEFVEENHVPGRFDYTPKDYEEIVSRVSNSQNPLCREAWSRLEIANRIITQRGSAIDGVILAAQLHRKDGDEPLVLIREDGWGPAIELLTPVFNWYEEGRADFVWPGEGRIRLEGYGHISIDPRNSHLKLNTDYQKRRPTTIPFDKIRKVRLGGFGTGGGRDVWRNPLLYHVELSHKNETTFSKDGQVIIELKEDQKDAEKWAGLLCERHETLKRVR